MGAVLFLDRWAAGLRGCLGVLQSLQNSIFKKSFVLFSLNFEEILPAKKIKLCAQFFKAGAG